jgi:hypothetical protein
MSPLLVHHVRTYDHDLYSDSDEEEGHDAWFVAADNCIYLAS